MNSSTQSNSWDSWMACENEGIRKSGRWRQMRALDGGAPRARLSDGRDIVSFASNDYLGLSQHPEVGQAARDAVDRWGTGSGSSRLIVGDRTVHVELEAALAMWRRTEAALVLPSGYHANLAVLSTFGAGARIVSDELNHASIIDGARLARAEVTIYRHGDAGHAEDLVRTAPGRALVVSDTVFSMDGDVAPVGELAELCARHGALLVLDDAHAVLEDESDRPEVDLLQLDLLRVGTLSKTLGSQGGYVAGSQQAIDFLVNRARPFIFTTGLAPPSAAAATAALRVCRSAEGDALRSTLRGYIERLRPGHPSPILPVVLGDEEAALCAAGRLLDAGLLVPAIRPPTVPAGTSRLRVSVSAAHHDSEVERLRAALERLT